MELRQLRYLIGIIDYGSFSKASAQLRVAQPALSQQIAHLEMELQAPLLIRTSQGVTPTDAGRQFYKNAQQILRQVQQARADALGSGAGGKQIVGTVSLALPTSTMTILALRLLEEVRDTLPGVRLKLVESLSGHLLELLLNQRIDCAVLFRDAPTKGISIETIAEEDVYAASADPLTENQPIPFRELSGVPLAIPSRPHGMRELVEGHFREHNLTLNIVAEVDSLPTLRGIAASGFATVILPQSALVEPSAEGRIYSRPITEPVITRPLSICRSQGASRERPADAVTECVKRVVADLINSGRWQGARLRKDK